MDRRQFLAATAVGVTASAAGCVEAVGSLDSTTYGREPPLVEDRPDAIYHPTHTEAMAPGGTATTSDGLRVHLLYTFPHRFWRVFRRDDGAGYESRQFAVDADDAVHLMVTLWDAETGVVLPVSSVDIAARGGNGVDERETVYAMLSQRMGFHYGDNYHLDGDDTYTVDITVGATTATRFGAFEGRFGEPETVTVDLEYSEVTRNELAFERYEDRQGEPGAVDPMAMSMSGTGMDETTMPLGRARDLGGESLGAALADDIRYRAALRTDSRFGEDPYLAVTAATRYNDLVVLDIGLRAVAGDDASSDSAGDGPAESVLDTTLSPGLDPELGFHYGAAAPSLTGEASVRLDVTVPPQVARHEGYETAFFGTPTVDLQ